MLDFGCQSFVTHIPVSLYILMKLMRGTQLCEIKRLKTSVDFLQYISDDVNAMSQHARNSIYLLVRTKVNFFKFHRNLQSSLTWRLKI
jgi:hypothetical protein